MSHILCQIMDKHGSADNWIIFSSIVTTVSNGPVLQTTNNTQIFNHPCMFGPVVHSKIQCITIKTMLAMMAQLRTVAWSDHCAVSYKVKPASCDPMLAMTRTAVIFAAVHTLCYVVYNDSYSWFQMRFSCIVINHYQVLNISPSLSCRLRVTLHVVKCSTIMNIHYWWKWLLAITQLTGHYCGRI